MLSSHTKARWWLIAWLAFTGCCLAISISPKRIDFRLRKTNVSSDIEFYELIASRVAGGDGYYEALKTELPKWGFPTTSVFNWRPPMPLWALGNLPNPRWGGWALSLLTVVLLGVGVVLLRRDEGRLGAAIGGLLLAGVAVLHIQPNFFYMPILWGGTLMGLSLCAFGCRLDGWGVGLGIAAAFFRELAIGYCIVMWCLACWRRDRREWLSWTVGIVAFAIYFGVHASRVSQQVVENPISASSDWVQFNGLAFVVGIAQINGFLLLLPQWVAGLFFAMAAGGLFCPTSVWQVRVSLTALAFVLVFLVIGQTINQYWGALVAPLFCFGAARSPAVATKLWKRAFAKP